MDFQVGLYEICFIYLFYQIHFFLYSILMVILNFSDQNLLNV